MYPSVVVIADIRFNHVSQGFPVGEAMAVIPFPFENTPEAFHWPIVDAVCHARHALSHARLFKFVMKCPIRVLKTSVTVEQWMRVRIQLNRFVEGFVNQRVIVAFPDDISDDTSVAKIENGTEVELVYFDTLIPFELSHVGKPLLVGLVGTELAVEQVLCDILRILRPSGAAVIAVLYGGLNAPDAANAQHALVIDMDVVIVTQFIVDPAITFVGILGMDGFNTFG